MPTCCQLWLHLAFIENAEIYKPSWVEPPGSRLKSGSCWWGGLRDWEYKAVLIFSKSGCLEISIHQMFMGLIQFSSQGRIQLLVTWSGINLWWTIWRLKIPNPANICLELCHPDSEDASKAQMMLLQQVLLGWLNEIKIQKGKFGSPSVLMENDLEDVKGLVEDL